MRLFQYLVNKTTKVALSARVMTKKDLLNKCCDNPTSYAQMVNYILRTYVTGEIIAAAGSEINQFRQASWGSPPECAQELQ